MPAEIQDSSKADNQPGGHPYFDLKSTLQLFIKEKRWSSLEEASRNMINLYPEIEYGWFALGMASAKLGDHNAAILNFKKAVYLNPDFLSSYYQLGISYFNQKDFANSIQFYQEALKRGMKTHTIYYNIGNAWYSIGDNDKAISNYLKSLSICPDFTSAAYSLFRIYFGNEDYKNAVSSLSPVISDDKLPSYLLAQARLLYENESETNYLKLRQALKLLNSAIDLDDTFALAYYERAYVKTRLGDTIGFAHDKAMAFQLNPDLRKGHLVNLFSTSYL